MTFGEQYDNMNVEECLDCLLSLGRRMSDWLLFLEKVSEHPNDLDGELLNTNTAETQEV